MVHGVFRKMEEELQVLVSWGPPAFKDCFVLLFEKVFLFSLQFHTSASIRNSFKKQTNKSNTDLHNHSHPEAAIFKTSLCSFWKVLVQRQKSENRQMFSSSFFFLSRSESNRPPGSETESFDPYDWRASKQTQELLQTFLWWDNGNSTTEALRLRGSSLYFMPQK